MSEENRFSSSVNVGGPDGPTPGADPPITVASLLVAWDGAESRAWLWDELHTLRLRYEARYCP